MDTSTILILIDIFFMPFLSVFMLELIKIFYGIYINRKNYFIYIIISTGVLIPICNLQEDFVILKLIISLLVYFILNYLLIKATLKSSFLSVGIYFVVTFIADILSGVTGSFLLNMPMLEMRYLPIPKFTLYSFYLLFNFLFILFIVFFKKKNSNVPLTNDNKNLIILAYVFLTLIYISLNYYIYFFILKSIHLTIIGINAFIVLIYFLLSIYTLYNSQRLTYSTEENLQLKSYINTITKLHDELKRFRHNYLNILQGIKGYAESENLEGLNAFLNELNNKSQTIKNIDVFDLSKINEPAIKSLLFAKLSLASAKNIKIILETSENISNIKMGISDLCEVLGVFLDNAIEECEKLESKDRRMEIIIDTSEEEYIFVIANTYKEKPEMSQLFKKGYSSKQEKNHGIGLFEAKNIINSYKNVLLNTYLEHDTFVQELQIKQ